MLPHFFLIGIVSAAAAVSDPPDCGWKIMFPYVPCIEAGSPPSHAGNETTSPHNCYQSVHSGACVDCGYWEGRPALVSSYLRYGSLGYNFEAVVASPTTTTACLTKSGREIDECGDTTPRFHLRHWLLRFSG